MVKAFLFSLLAGAEAGTLAVTWEDCGSQHSKITDLQPTTIETGSTTTITGTGTVDEDVTAATFSATVKAAGVKVADCDGDGTEDIVCKLPLGAGVITVKKVAYPLAAGQVSIAVDVKTISLIPASLQKVDTHIEASDQNGESVICMDVHTNKAMSATSQPSFDEWAAEYGFNGHSEMKAAYEENVKMIEEFNEQNEDGEWGVNKFSGYTLEQFQDMFTGEVGDDEDMPRQHVEPLQVAVTDVDWSTRTDVVNPVKDQGSCGSCWAFGAVGVLEPRWALKTDTLHTLAEQQLVDCDTSSHGCQGGLSRYSFSGYYKSHGACSTSSYPYKATGSTCRDTSCSVLIPSGSVTGYNEITASASALKSALMDGPLKVSVYAESTFQHYSSGISSGGSCKGSTNHAVVAVGYGSGFIKIRNSWGSSWGESGHIRVSDTSSCSSGNFDMFVRTPIFPSFASSAIAV